jgi:hypothetical protein
MCNTKGIFSLDKFSGWQTWIATVDSNNSEISHSYQCQLLLNWAER